MIQAWLDFIQGVVLFDTDVYARHVAREDVMKRGVLLFVVVTLLAGSVPFLIDTARALVVRNQPPPQQMEEIFGPMAPYMGEMPPEFELYVLPNIQAGIELGWRIAQLKTPLPKFLSVIFEFWGDFVSSPWGRLARWMGYTLLVLLVAKLLGGYATLPQMLGATALYIVPHILGIFNFIPCLGGLLGFVALLWGIAIYIKAVAVANHFSLGRAVVATVMPVAVFVVFQVIIALGVLIIVSLAGSA
jgi:hypothetical protein